MDGRGRLGLQLKFVTKTVDRDRAFVVEVFFAFLRSKAWFVARVRMIAFGAVFQKAPYSSDDVELHFAFRRGCAEIALKMEKSKNNSVFWVRCTGANMENFF